LSDEDFHQAVDDALASYESGNFETQVYRVGAQFIGKEEYDGYSQIKQGNQNAQGNADQLSARAARLLEEEISRAEGKRSDLERTGDQDAGTDQPLKPTASISVKEAEKASRDVVSQIVPGAKQQTWLNLGTKDRAVVVKYEGEINQEAMREQTPDSYLSTAYDLRQYSISATDLKAEFLTGFGKLRPADAAKFLAPAKEKAGTIAAAKIRSAAKSTKKKTRDTIPQLKTIADEIGKAKSVEQLYDIAADSRSFSEGFSANLIEQVFQRTGFETSGNRTVDKPKTQEQMMADAA